MKTILTFILIFCSITTYSQNIDIRDTTINFISDKIYTQYSQPNPIADISVYLIKFNSGKKGISFSLRSIIKGKTPNIRIDSISLVSINGKILILSLPYRDTVYLTSKGLSQTIIYELNDFEINTLKTNTICKIILPIDKIPFIINLSKKAQIDLAKTSILTY